MENKNRSRSGQQRHVEVMVVDDDYDLVEVTRLALEDHRIPTSGASSGAEAIAAIESGAARPTIVLLDLLLVDMTGLEIVKRLEAAGHRDALAIVLMTGAHVDEIDAAKVDAVLRKPFGIDALLKTVIDVTGIGATARATRSR